MNIYWKYDSYEINSKHEHIKWIWFFCQLFVGQMLIYKFYKLSMDIGTKIIVSIFNTIRNHILSKIQIYGPNQMYNNYDTQCIKIFIEERIYFFNNTKVKWGSLFWQNTRLCTLIGPLAWVMETEICISFCPTSWSVIFNFISVMDKWNLK